MGLKTNESWLNCLSYNVNNPGKDLDRVSKFLAQRKIAEKQQQQLLAKKLKK